MKLKSWFLIFVIFLSCKDKYMPHIQYPPAGFLVAEGFINAGDSPTSILLTRASQLDSIQLIPETGALLDVQAENGASYPLTEDSGGKYTIAHIPIDPGERYRLHIKTSNGKEYLSDLTEVKISPPIDTVGFNAGPEDVSIYVSTHDDQKKSQYYQWQFEETWAYNAAYISYYIYNKTAIPFPFSPRPNASANFNCWNTGLSSGILIASTISLSSDLVYQFPLTKISYTASNRLTMRYSILVKQTVLSKEGYEWTQQLKKNTEQLGSIFDAQPSETGGNIHNISDPSERVIGFIGCSTQTEKRIFITRNDLPPVQIINGNESCMADTILLSQNLDLYFGDGALFPLSYEKTTKGMAMTGAGAGCVDCRAQGGTIVKPAFW
jgi:Domain of unknown function (DUF4249)